MWIALYILCAFCGFCWIVFLMVLLGQGRLNSEGDQ
jgi:hypothetical protein